MKIYKMTVNECTMDVEYTMADIKAELHEGTFIIEGNEMIINDYASNVSIIETFIKYYNLNDGDIVLTIHNI